MRSIFRESEGMLWHSPHDGLRILNVLTLACALLSFSQAQLTILLYPVQLRYLVGPVVVFLISLVLLGLLRLRRPIWAAHVLCSIFLASAVPAALINGIRVPAAALSFVSVSLAGYLLGLRSAFTYAFLLLACLWIIFGLQVLGYIDPIDPPVQTWAGVLFVLLIFTGIILVIPLRGLLRAHALLVEERRKLSESIREHEARSKGLENEVERRTEDLRVINADLERFPLALAHDLRTPLQSLSGYATLLMGNEQETRRRQALERLQQAVEGFDVRLNQALHAGRETSRG